MTITVCGSVKFKDQINDAIKNLTLDDHIVIPLVMFEPEEYEKITQEQRIRLDNLHRMKINMSDAIFVVNVDGYIGESTFGYIDWAVRNKKELYFLVNPNPEAEKDGEEKTEEEVPAVESEEK